MEWIWRSTFISFVFRPSVIQIPIVSCLLILWPLRESPGCIQWVYYWITPREVCLSKGQLNVLRTLSEPAVKMWITSPEPRTHMTCQEENPSVHSPLYHLVSATMIIEFPAWYKLDFYWLIIQQQFGFDCEGRLRALELLEVVWSSLVSPFEHTSATCWISSFEHCHEKNKHGHLPTVTPGTLHSRRHRWVILKLPHCIPAIPEPVGSDHKRNREKSIIVDWV